MKQSKIKSLGEFQTNKFGDQYLFLVNKNTFNSNDCNSVFSSHYGHLFEPNSLYIIAGTDSGLLPKWIKSIGVPEGSHYVFADLPEVIHKLDMHAIIEDESSFTVLSIDEVKEFLDSPIAERYMFHDRISLHRSQAVLNADYADYQPFWRQLNSIVELFLWKIINTYTVHTRTNIQLQNMADNQYSAIRLKNSFKGKTAVLLAGGPSLDDNIKWVKDNRDKVLVAAVSRICRSLIANDITPDIIVTVDPYQYNLFVSKDIHAFHDNALLVNGHYLNPELLSLWQGRKAHIGSCFPWKTKREPEFVELGCPTVTNSAYVLLVEMGFQQIVLLGVDFCFSQDGYTHAKESTESDAGPMPMIGIFQTKTNSGKTADTNNQYLQAAQELEKMAKTGLDRGCTTINPSANSMQLENIKYSSLDHLELGSLNEPASKTIQRHIPLASGEERRQYLIEATEEIDHTLQEIKQIYKLASKALSCNNKIYHSSSRENEAHYRQKMDLIEDTINTKFAHSSEFIKRYRIQNFIAIIRLNSEKTRTDKETKTAGEAYYQAYMQTSDELNDVLTLAKHQLESRLEEYSDQINITKLLSLWKKTGQLARAVLWKNENQALVKHASEQDQESFLNIEKQYEQNMLLMEHNLKSGSKVMSCLDGVQGKALECLTQNNSEGLRSICKALELHHDQKQAKKLTEIVNAYLLELTESNSKAITCYNIMLEGNYKFDALKRLLSIYMKNNNRPLTLQTLAQLAEISSTFVPPLAEMLSLMNETDQAIDLYTDYLLLTPDDLQSMFKLGKLYHQLGSQEGAEWAMNYILEKDPSHELAKQLLAEAS